jgi:RHS repeat-associated protein
MPVKRGMSAAGVNRPCCAYACTLNGRCRFTGIYKPDAADPTKEAYNPYRFNAKRWDTSSGMYDMGFRDYDPGLNRFTTRDMYNGALSDMGLGTDPMTSNRYAFTGGNPVNRMERDGHEPECFGYNSSTCPRTEYASETSGPGQWGDAWMMDSGSEDETTAEWLRGELGDHGCAWASGACDAGSAYYDDPADSGPEPEDIPVWESYVGGVIHTTLTGFTQLNGGSEARQFHTG